MRGMVLLHVRQLRQSGERCSDARRRRRTVIRQHFRHQPIEFLWWQRFAGLQRDENILLENRAVDLEGHLEQFTEYGVDEGWKPHALEVDADGFALQNRWLGRARSAPPRTCQQAPPGSVEKMLCGRARLPWGSPRSSCVLVLSSLRDVHRRAKGLAFRIATARKSDAQQNEDWIDRRATSGKRKSGHQEVHLRLLTSFLSRQTRCIVGTGIKKFESLIIAILCIDQNTVTDGLLLSPPFGKIFARRRHGEFWPHHSRQ